jgi:hypothetical protein
MAFEHLRLLLLGDREEHNELGVSRYRRLPALNSGHNELPELTQAASGIKVEECGRRFDAETASGFLVLWYRIAKAHGLGPSAF